MTRPTMQEFQAEFHALLQEVDRTAYALGYATSRADGGDTCAGVSALTKDNLAARKAALAYLAFIPEMVGGDV